METESVELTVSRRSDFVSSEAKHYFSLGTTFASVVLPTLVTVAWAVLKREFPPYFQSELWPLGFSFLLSFSVAYIIPEPAGYPNEGKMKLTWEEIIFGVANSFVLFLTVIGTEKVLSTCT